MTSETTPENRGRTAPGNAPAQSSPVVVVGAGGYVGSRLAAALARTGRTVLAASRRPVPELVSDGGPGPGLVRPVTYAEATGLGDAVREACDRDDLPLPGSVAASIGGWQLGARLLDEPGLDTWRSTLDSHLTAHLATVRALAPLLRDSTDPNPVYVVLNGAARAEPMAGSGAVSVTGAGLAMLVQVLRLEENTPAPPAVESASAGAPARTGQPRRLRFHELVIGHAVAGDDRNVTPEQTVAPTAVADALTRILDDPATAAVVHVGELAGNGD